MQNLFTLSLILKDSANSAWMRTPRDYCMLLTMASAFSDSLMASGRRGDTGETPKNSGTSEPMTMKFVYYMGAGNIFFSNSS